MTLTRGESYRAFIGSDLESVIIHVALNNVSEAIKECRIMTSGIADCMKTIYIKLCLWSQNDPHPNLPTKTNKQTKLLSGLDR